MNNFHNIDLTAGINPKRVVNGPFCLQDQSISAVTQDGKNKIGLEDFDIQLKTGSELRDDQLATYFEHKLWRRGPMVECRMNWETFTLEGRWARPCTHMQGKHVDLLIPKADGILQEVASPVEFHKSSTTFIQLSASRCGYHYLRQAFLTV